MAGIAVSDSASELLPEDMNQIKVRKPLHISDIIKSQGARLQGFIRKRVRSGEDAEDVLQDVYYQLAEADYLMKPIEQITAWLFTVARNRITDHYRKRKPEPIPEIYEGSDDDDLHEDLSGLMFDDGITPETEYLRSLVWEELEEALSELPEEQRQAFELHEMKGLSFKEISKITGETVNTLISRKRYAVLFLRERLQIIYDELMNF